MPRSSLSCTLLNEQAGDRFHAGRDDRAGHPVWPVRHAPGGRHQLTNIQISLCFEAGWALLNTFVMLVFYRNQKQKPDEVEEAEAEGEAAATP